MTRRTLIAGTVGALVAVSILVALLIVLPSSSRGPEVRQSAAETPTPSPCPVAREGALDGPAPWGGCWPGPRTTGVPAGTSLTAYTGPKVVTADGTVIDSKILGCIAIDASDVVIRKSVIDCGSGAFSAVTILDNSSMVANEPVLIEDSEIDCEMAPSITGITEGHFTLRRVEIRRCVNGASINQRAVIENSLIHRLSNTDEDPHEDGVQLSFGHWTGSAHECCARDVTIRRNTIKGLNDDGSHGTSAIISNPTADGRDRNIRIEANFFEGGATTLYCPRPGTGVNYEVIDNRFSEHFAFGRSDDCADERQSGNVIHETGEPVTLD